MPNVLWNPSPERIADANLTRFMQGVGRQLGRTMDRYEELYAWSIEEPAAFWSELARFAGIRAEWRGPALEHPQRMPGARFFPEARLNFAQNLLRSSDERPALVFRNERGARRVISHRELSEEVARIASG